MTNNNLRKTVARAIVPFVCAVTAIMVVPASANTEEVSNLTKSELRRALASKIRVVQHMALNPVIIRAVKKQNAQTLTAKEIDARDQHWQNSTDEDMFKLSQMGNAAGRLLRDQVTSSEDYSEAFVTDRRGANVAVFPLTGDYNQGDEGKFSNSWNNGDGQLFIGDPELDDSTGLQAVQISAPVMDRGVTIGVLIVGVTFEYIDGRVK